MSNCRNCGAPLPQDLKSGRHVCEFCDTTSMPARESTLIESVVDLGDETEHECPICSRRLHQALLDDNQIESCPGCRGLLFNDLVFAAAVRNQRASYGEYGRAARPIDPDAYDRRLNCCRCQRPMQVHPYYGPGNVVIDSCFPCGLIWVDAGELVQIAQAPGKR